MLERASYAGGNDALLIALARRGDKAAFSELAARHQSWLRNLLRWLCAPDLDLADDLAQTALLTAWRKLKQLKDAKRFQAWLRRIAITTHLQHVRAQKQEVAWDDSFEESEQPDLDKRIDLDQALCVLPPRVRTAIVLAYNEGMSHNEIATLCDIPLGTVKSDIRRGTAQLRDMLPHYQQNESEL